MGRTKKIYTFDQINAEASRIDRALKISEAVRNTVTEREALQSLEDDLDAKNVEILELKHQVIGYKAVISYLEHQLGLSKSQ